MRDWDSTQESLVASEHPTVSWLFTITTQYDEVLRFSTSSRDYGGESFEARIPENSFRGFPRQSNVSGDFNMVAPMDFEFGISNADQSYDASDFDDAELLLELVVASDGEEDVVASVAMDIPAGYCFEIERMIHVKAVSFIQKYLAGFWPVRKQIRDIFPSDDPSFAPARQDNMCVPIPIGTASYIPVRPVLVIADNARRYVIGLDSNTDTYDLQEVRAPRARGNQTWPHDSVYAFNETDRSGYRVVEFLIDDANGDGVYESNGLWSDGSYLYDAFLKYSMNRTRHLGGEISGTHTGGDSATLEDSGNPFIADVMIGSYVVNTTTGAYGLITANTAGSITASLSSGDWSNGDGYRVGGPASVIRFMFCDSTDGIGMPTSRVDDDAWGAAEAQFAEWGLVWKNGFFTQRSVEEQLADLLKFCNSHLVVGEQLKLVPYDRTSQMTLTTKVRENSFKLTKIDRSQYDSARVAWAISGDPCDMLATALVPFESTTDSPSTDTMECPLIDDSIHAQNLVHLWGQRKYLRGATQSFKYKFSAIQLEPGDMITVVNDLYGDVFEAMVESITIDLDLTTTLETVSFETQGDKNMLGNPSFETAGGGGADVFGTWVEYQPGSSTVNDDTSENRATGAHCARLDIDGSGNPASVSQSLTVQEGRQYKFKIWGKTSSATKHNRYIIRENAGGTDYLRASDGVWLAYDPINSFGPGTTWVKDYTYFTIQTGVTGVLASMSRHNTESSYSVYYDDVSFELLTILDDWDDLDYSSVTVGDSTTDSTTPWSAVVSGGDGDGQNVMPGRVILGSGSDNILLDSDNSVISMTVNSVEMVQIGDLGSQFGIQVLNSTGDIVFLVDDTPQAKFAGWDLTDTTISADSGSLTISSAIPAILMGSATDYMTGEGAFMGKYSGQYAFHFGDPDSSTGQYISYYDGVLTITGEVYEVPSGGYIAMPDEGWIGLAVDGGRWVFDSMSARDVLYAMDCYVGVGVSPGYAFEVQADGATATDQIYFHGEDDVMPWALYIGGHAGGSLHTQLSTFSADSRITVQAAEADDKAPRFQVCGPVDSVTPGVRGSGIFDYGSLNYDLPDAYFAIRYMYEDSGGEHNINMVTCKGMTEVVVNDNSNDVDFRVESDANVNAFFVQGSDSYVGIGIVPEDVLHIYNASDPTLNIQKLGGSVGSIAFTAGAGAGAATYAEIVLDADEAMTIGTTTSQDLYFQTNDAVRATIDNSGNLGIGTTNPQAPFHYVGTNGMFYIANGESDTTSKGMRLAVPHYNNAEEPAIIIFGYSDGTGNVIDIGGGTSLGNAATAIKFYTASDDTTTSGTLCGAFNTSGYFFLGPSTASISTGGNTAIMQAHGLAVIGQSWTRWSDDASSAFLTLGKSRGTAVADYTIVQDGDSLGFIRFAGSDGTNVGTYPIEIRGEVEGTPSANTIPGRLRFRIAEGLSADDISDKMVIEPNHITGFYNWVGILEDDVYSLDFYNYYSNGVARIAVHNDHDTYKNHGKFVFSTMAGASLTERVVIPESGGFEILGSTYLVFPDAGADISLGIYSANNNWLTVAANLVRFTDGTAPADKYADISESYGFRLWTEAGGSQIYQVTASGNIVGGAQNFDRVSDTSDGSDSKRVSMGGGGSVDDSRGAYVSAYGNEHATYPGKLLLSAGESGDVYISGDQVFYADWGASKSIESDDYVSQTTGWSIKYGSNGGDADFRYIYADELHVKAFTTDVYEAFAGGIVITKSRAKLSRTFTIPDTGNSAVLYVEDLDGMSDTPVFEVNDYVLLRVIQKEGVGLIVQDIFGQVTGYSGGSSGSSELNEGEQSWTFTTTTTGYGSGDLIYSGSIALDYGQSGEDNGIWLATVLDTESPYSDVQVWDGTLSSGEPDPTHISTYSRAGNLSGISGLGGSAGDEFGMWAGNGTGDTDQQIIVSNFQATFKNIDVAIHDGSNPVILLEHSTPYFSIGADAPTAYGGDAGFWVGKDSGAYKAYIGDPSSEWLTWDSTSIKFKNGANVLAELSGSIWTLGITSAEYLQIDTNGVSLYDNTAMYARFASTTTIGLTASEHVNITSTSVQFKDGSSVYTDLTAGVLTLGLTSGGEYVTISSSGVSMYSATNERVHIANDGTGWIGGSGNFSWDASGNVTLSGTITAEDGNIGGFYIGATDIWAGNSAIGNSATVLVLSAEDTSLSPVRIALGASADSISLLGDYQGFYADGDGFFYAGDGGNNYIAFRGSGLECSTSGVFNIFGDFNIGNSGNLNIGSGGNINIEGGGGLNIEGSGFINFEGGGGLTFEGADTDPSMIVFAGDTFTHRMSTNKDGDWTFETVGSAWIPDNDTSNPSSTSDPSSDWTGESNVYTSNDAYATFSGAGTSGYLRVTGFSFSFPSAAVDIVGIKVEIERHADWYIGGVAPDLEFYVPYDYEIKLLKAGTEVGDNKSSGAEWFVDDAYVSFGGQNDLWGTTWSEAEVDASNFGVSVKVTNPNANNVAYIDHVRITVYFRTSAGTGYIERMAFADATEYGRFGYDGISNGASITCYHLNFPYVGATIKTSGDIWPDTDEAYDIGISGGTPYKYAQCYANNWNEVADYCYFDDRDDLAAIHQIKGSGAFDPNTGNEIIDDASLPDWLLSRHKITGEIVYDSKGKPFLAPSRTVPLAWGGIKQVDNKLEDYVSTLQQQIADLQAQVDALKG